MPKLELKLLQKELEKEILWPVYWLYGQESWKAREAISWIRKKTSSDWGLGPEILNGGEVSVRAVIDSAKSLTLGSGVSLVIVRDAHLLQNLELISELLGPSRKLSELTSVCIFQAKELDGRKKISKILLEKAAVVPCEEVAEFQREFWIAHLAKRKELTLDQSLVMRLTALEPWSLDSVEQELEKLKVAGTATGAGLEDLIVGSSSSKAPEIFLDRFFQRDLKGALPYVSYFADDPNESLPLLGLLGWNLRQLILYLTQSEQKESLAPRKINPYLLERLRKWGRYWKLEEIVSLQQDLEEMDFKLKQTPLLPLGLWSSIVMRHCK